MELKLFSAAQRILRHLVWIAPLWNWNLCSPSLWRPLCRFESHLYGIETRSSLSNIWMKCTVWIAPLWNWNFWRINQFIVKQAFESHLYGIESICKKCLGEEWGKLTGNQLLFSFWLKTGRTGGDGNMTRWDWGTLPIRNLCPKWWKVWFRRMKKVTNDVWKHWWIVSY